MNTFILLAAANYSCNAYGAGTYNNATCTTSTGTSSDGGVLANTGYDIIIPVALALAVIIAGVIALVHRALRRKKAAPNA